MYPGPDDPDLGVFVANLERELVARARLRARRQECRRGRARHLALARDAFRTARRFHPDVVYAHFLVPAGLAAALASRAPLVVTAHGQDVANAARPGIRAATRYVVRRAAAVVAVSGWLRRGSNRRRPTRGARPRSSTAGGSRALRATGRGCGTGRARLEPEGVAPRSSASALSRSGRTSSASRAFERRGEGELAFVGDGRCAVRSRVGPNSGRRGGPRCGPGVGRGLRRPLPAEPRRALRACHAGGDGVRALRWSRPVSEALPSS